MWTIARSALQTKVRTQSRFRLSNPALSFSPFHTSKPFLSNPLRPRSIVSLLEQSEDDASPTEVTQKNTLLIHGWVRSIRIQKQQTFITINDGSSLAGIQVVLDSQKHPDASIQVGASIQVSGRLQKSFGTKQKYEVLADGVNIIGPSDEDYPLQKKRHTLEYLRDIAHLRPRSNTIGAMLRIRNAATFSIQTFFKKQGFIQIHAPILTASDCEGAGEMFELKDPPANPQTPFFGSTARLSVSAQLQAEIFACSLSKVYTFNPIFRAEPSHTTRHLAEFWMVEPEIAHADLSQLMDITQELIKSVVSDVIVECRDDIAFMNERIDPTLQKRLESLSSQSDPFQRMTYTDAIQTLKASGSTFQHPVEWGKALQSEHERYLVERHFNGRPVFVTHYPAGVKPFYMREVDSECGPVVTCFDLLVPTIGELVGGSEREWSMRALQSRMEHLGMSPEGLDWYLQLRRWGSVPHGGFGLGFERLIMLLTGLQNIRDVIPIPRYPGFCRF